MWELNIQQSAGMHLINRWRSIYNLISISTNQSDLAPPPFTVVEGLLGFTMGIPLGTGDRPIPVPTMGLYLRCGYRFGHGYQVWYPYLYLQQVYPWGMRREGGPR